MVFVDTGAWFSYFVPSDADHVRIEACIDTSPQPLVTTDFCVDETLTLLAARGRLHRAIDAGRAFFHHGIATIKYPSPDQIHRAWILFQQRAAAGWSFTDCTSKIVIDELGVATAIALDDHFRQFGNVTVVP